MIFFYFFFINRVQECTACVGWEKKKQKLFDWNLTSGSHRIKTSPNLSDLSSLLLCLAPSQGYCCIMETVQDPDCNMV